MISIKRFLDHHGRPSANERLEDVSRLRSLLVEGLEARQQARWEITSEFRLAVRELLIRLEKDRSVADQLGIACETLELFEQHSRETTGFFEEESSQMQSMVVMLTDTIAGIAAQSDASISDLQSIERQIQQVSSMEDIRCLKAHLASCLAEIRERIVQQRNAMQASVKRLQDQIHSPRPLDAQSLTPGFRGFVAATNNSEADYVIAFKLQRSEHIRSRFGEVAIEQMLALVQAGLKPAQRSADRLMRWKRDSFLMFASSSETIGSLRQRFSAIVSGICRRHIEVGKNSALLAIGVDWTILVQAQYPSLDRLFLDVDLFLGEMPKEGS